METPDVRVGQIWQDCDKRQPGRFLRIIYVHEEKKKADCYVGTRRSDGSYSWGRRTEIALHRFRPTSTGYRLIAEEQR